MNKLKITFFISLFIVLIISIGSISAQNIDSNDYQILDDTDNEDISLNDGIFNNAESNDDILNDAQLNDEPLENNDLSDEISTDDSEIAENIKVNFSNTVFVNDTGNISVELPEDASGYLRVTIDDEEIYNQSITDRSVQIPIVIPKNKFPYLVVNRNSDYSMHSISVFYNEISLDLNHTLKVMYRPPDSGFVLNAPEEILKDDDYTYQTIGLIFPYSANGLVEIYIDDVLFEKRNATPFTLLNISEINRLELGSHSIKAIYFGDEYYGPCERNSSFEIVDFLIDIPSDIVLDHNDVIYAKSVKYTDGTINVYFDGKRILSKKFDGNHEFLESLFSKVTCGEHLIEVQYNSSKFNYSKQQAVNISYLVDIWGYRYRYGDDNSVNIIVPPDFNASLVHITIDGKAYKIKIDDSGWIELNVSKLTAGNHTLVFDFEGDKKYYDYHAEHNFTVRYDYKIPDFIDYLDGSVVSIDLPSSANGNLELYVDGKLYKSVKLVKGKSSIKVDMFSCGDHNISLNYTGDDFEIENVSSSITVCPKVVSPITIECGENKSIVVYVSNDTKGYITFTVETKQYNVTIKNGKAILPLKGFKIGEYFVDADYMGPNGETSFSYAYLEVLPAKIKITGAKNKVVRYTSNSYYKVKVYNNQSKLAKGVTVSFKVGKKTFKVKTDKNGVAKLKLSKFAPKTYKIVVSYKGTKVTKKLTVKHILNLKKVKVRKSARKLVLTASLKKVNGKYLKGKVIKFKFKGKTYKAKTNKKGVAKVTIKSKVLKKLKIGKKISYKASYLKDSAKRTVKVKG